jgi:hypothetical protein
MVDLFHKPGRIEEVWQRLLQFFLVQSTHLLNSSADPAGVPILLIGMNMGC